jgi:hypothetical protein
MIPPMMPPMMPHHLMNNHTPYMNMPYNPSFPQTQQFIDPYQQYQLLRQQREQEQLQQPQLQQKGKVKRAQSFVPPQIQKHHGKTITDLKKKKDEQVDNKTDSKKTQQSLQHIVTAPSQQPFSLQKWFGPNASTDITQSQMIQSGFIVPQNAISLEEIEASFKRSV